MTTPYFNPANNYEDQHVGSEALAINNTSFRRFLVRLALHTTAKFFHRDGPCIPVSRHKILKKGFSVHLTEAITMDYVARNTSIPVPKSIHPDGTDPRRDSGSSLAALIKGISTEDILAVEKHDKELRALQPPLKTGVESCVGGSLYESRLPNGTPRFGPFKTIQEFHRWLRDGPDENTRPGDHVSDEDAAAIKAMIVKQDGPWPAPIFTHGDLNPFNILVRGDQIVGIIDWEFSGWYPPYWEYTSAWFGNVIRSEWQSVICSLLDPYPEELEMERTRQRWWGEF